MLCQFDHCRDCYCVANGRWDLLLELSAWRRRMGPVFVLDDSMVELVGPSFAVEGSATLIREHLGQGG